MSDITSPSAIVNVQWQEEKPADDGDKKRHDPPASKVAETYEQNARSVTDHITILGIPVELMTNQVQAMIGGLVSETSFFKSKVKRLERLAAKDVPADVQVLDSETFAVALDQALGSSPEPGRVRELVLIAVSTFEDIRRSSGILAANATLADVAAAVIESELPVQCAGLIGGPIIAVLLSYPEADWYPELDAPPENELTTADRVRAVLEGRSYSVSGLEMNLSFKVAAARVETGQSALHAIGQVDHVLRG